MKGISIIETVLVIGITLIVGASGLQIGGGFMERNNVRTKSNEVTSALRIAQLNAMSGKENGSWGVSIQIADIVIFKGDSYATRDNALDQNFRIPASITLTGPEIVFAKDSGIPNQVGTYVISGSSGGDSVTVNEVGSVDVVAI